MTTKATALTKPLEGQTRDSSRPERPKFSNHELLTVHDVSAMLHVPVSWVYEHTRRGAPEALPVVKIGKYLRFRPADLWDYIERKSRDRSCR
jgi:hypothetical protein